MLYLYYSLLLIGLYIYCGLGLTLLLCPPSLRKYVLFLSPLVGYCYLSLVGWWCYRFNLAGTDEYAPALMAPPFFFLYYALVRCRKESGRNSNELLNLELGAPLALGILAFLIMSAPMITTTKDITAVTLGNNDIATYAAASRYLKSFARTDVTGYLGQENSIKWLADESAFGTFLSTAIPSTLFSLETYQVQNINTHVFFLFGILIVYILARKIFQYNYYSALGITALYGLSPLIYYTAYQVFENQIIATALALCLVLINVQAINDCRSYRDYYSYFPLGVLLNWGVVITYPHMLPFIYVPVVVYVLLISFDARSFKTLFHWSLFVLGSLILVVALAPPRARTLGSYFFLMGNIEAGWFIPWLSPETWYGITFEKLEFPHSPLLRFVLSLPLGVLFLAGFISAYRKDKKLFFLAASSTLPLLIGYFLLSYLGRSGDSMGGYKSYKLLSFFLPLILLGLSIGFRDVKLRSQTRKQYALPLLLIILVGCNVVSCYFTVRLMAVSQTTLDKSVSDLGRIEYVSQVQSINIGDSDFWNVMWKINFLLRKKLFFRIGTQDQASLDGEWDLKPVSTTGDNLLKVRFQKDAPIPVSATYVLERVEPSRILTAKFGEGWYGPEETHIWMGEKADSATLVLQCEEDDLAVDVRLQYVALDSHNSLAIYLNERKVADCGGKQCQINGLTLLNGRNTLEFKTSLPPERSERFMPGSNDQRMLGYAFQNIEISVAKAAAAH